MSYYRSQRNQSKYSEAFVHPSMNGPRIFETLKRICQPRPCLPEDSKMCPLIQETAIVHNANFTKKMKIKECPLCAIRNSGYLVYCSVHQGQYIDQRKMEFHLAFNNPKAQTKTYPALALSWILPPVRPYCTRQKLYFAKYLLETNRQSNPKFLLNLWLKQIVNRPRSSSNSLWSL